MLSLTLLCCSIHLEEKNSHGAKNNNRNYGAAIEYSEDGSLWYGLGRVRNSHGRWGYSTSVRYKWQTTPEISHSISAMTLSNYVNTKEHVRVSPFYHFTYHVISIATNVVVTNLQIKFEF